MALADCLARRIQPGMHVTIGFSGGVDSLALLHACARGRDTLFNDGCSIYAVHVHHGLSSQADEWAAFCLSMAGDWGVPCQVVQVEVERGTTDGLEAAARRARHDVFARLDTDLVLLAHHQNDQAETVLFNLLRGAGLTGATGMDELNGRLLRPWLSVTRDQIVSYAQRHGLSWIEDQSNLDTRFSRNFLRHEVFPLLGRRFSASAANLAKAAGRFAEAEQLLDDLAKVDLADSPPQFPVAVDILRRLSPSRARNLVRYLLGCHDVVIPSAAKLEEAVRQVCEALPDKHPQIVFGRYRLVRMRGLIHLLPAETVESR